MQQVININGQESVVVDAGFEYYFCDNNRFIFDVDNWVAYPSDKIFTHCKNSIILPVSSFYGIEDNKVLNSFILTSKRCYNSNEVREHICQYLNYFEKYFDKEHELLFYIFRMKQLMDTGYLSEGGTSRPYTLDNFYNDIKTYILSDSMYNKVWNMVSVNYKLDLNYKNKNNEGLQYNNSHGKYLMEISLFMNMLIPLIMHFSYRNKITNVEKIHEIIFTIYNWLFDMYIDTDRMAKRGLPPADMWVKIYETASTIMASDYKTNQVLWNISEVRGFSPTINANDAINTVIMQVMPKYTYNGNVVTYNISSIKNNIRYNISDISYEFDYSALSSSKRDGEDNTSQFDKFEAHMVKANEALQVCNDFMANTTMNNIIARYGPFSQEEINFYRRALIKNGQPLINKFQQKLVNYMFFRFFGNTMSPMCINGDQYIILMIAAKRILLGDGMKLLPYIIASNVVQISSRTTLCKKELIKVEQSEYYNDICLKYRDDEKQIKRMLALIATILSSRFTIIDMDEEINGMEIKMESDILIDEVLRFIIQIWKFRVERCNISLLFYIDYTYFKWKDDNLWKNYQICSMEWTKSKLRKETAVNP